MATIEFMTGEANTNNPAEQGNQPPEPAANGPEPPNGGRPPVAAAGQGGGDREGSPRSPEGLRMPENPHSPEFELFGSLLVEEIIKLETTLSYERMHLENQGLITTSPEFNQSGRYLNRLYQELKKYIDVMSQHRNDLVPLDDQERYQAPAEQSADQAAADQPQSEQAAPQNQAGTEYERARARGELAPLAGLLNSFANPAERTAEVERQLLIYLREAHRRGLLTNATDVLDSTFQALQAGNVPGSPEEFIESRLRVARISAAAVYAKRQNELGMRDLKGIWIFYILLARERMLDIVNEVEQVTSPEEGEWDPAKAKEENYWRASSYPEYYEVTARTKEQFARARDTFLQMIKKRGLGLGPETVFAHLENFRKSFGRQAAEMAQEGVVSYDFAKNIRLELEGLSYLWGADYANEVYNPDQYKQFMTAMALHEGPERWTMVARSGEGRVAVSTWKWDRDPRLKLYHNPCGSRGQLANDTVTQNYLQQQIWQIIVEENMGVVIKDYEPRLGRPDPATDARNDEERAEARQKNIDRIGIYQSDEAFMNLYEGFEKRNAQGVVEERGYAHLDNWRKYGDLPESQWPKHLVNSVRIGKVQEKISQLRQQVINGQERSVSSDTDIPLMNRLLDRLRELNNEDEEAKVAEQNIRGITEADKKAYEAARDKANDSFDVAFQMIGASGEKVRRGGGVFYVDRNIYIQAYEKLEHIEDRHLSIDQRRAKRVGRILWFKRTPGAKLNPEDQDFNDRQMSPQEKMDYVDHMPVYMAEKFVQFAENWTKMMYGDDSIIWKEPEFKRRVEIKDENGNYRYPNFRAEYRAAMMKLARNRAEAQIKRNGFQAKLEWARYPADYLEKNGNKKAVTAFAPMMINTPTGGNINPQTGRLENAHAESKPADFNTTQTHWLSRWTSHTYFFYQQENRHMLLKPYVREQARRIKAGLLRAEDADQLAVFLLIVDPSLERVKQQGDSDMQREIEMVGAAVEESYQSHWRINRNLHRLFLPPDGNVHKMRMGYNREDYGGSSRFAMRIRDLVASQPRRFARRGAAIIADMPMEISSMPDIWGAEGMMGAISMFADPIRPMAAQGIASQFALTKFIDQMGYGWELFGALVGKLDGREVVDREGLYEKPTNNADKLQKWKQKGFNVQTFIEDQNDLFYAYVESFQRLDRVLKILRVLNTKTRNAEAPLWTEKKDIFLPDGSYNLELASDRDVGTSRHSAKIFYDTFIDWLTARGPGSGADTYPEEAPMYGWLNLIIVEDKDKPGKKKRIRDWLWEKMGR